MTPSQSALECAEELLAREARLTPADEPVSFANEGEDSERWIYTRKMAADVIYTMTNVHKLARAYKALHARTVPTRDELRATFIHLRIDDDSEEWESPQPRIAGFDKVIDAIIVRLTSAQEPT